MRRYVCLALVFVVLGFTGGGVRAEAGVPVPEQECFYLKSLHFTAKGMEHWYSKEQGGLELITGVPYSKLACQKCHAAGCDRCHRTEKGQRLSYTIKAAQNQNTCLECHGREKAMMRIDLRNKQEDVHLAKGMTCTDCHSQREMHGDGIQYVSLKQPGAMDTNCEKCHNALKPTDAHTVHEGKLDCKACHVRHVVSCTNCHFDHMVETGERKAIPVDGWVFLMNYKDKVSSANMQTFLVRPNKTFLMFAPHMSHSIMKAGRKCNDCHGTKSVNQINKEKKIKLTWMEDGKVVNVKGVIPIAQGVKYECAYLDLKDEKWEPVKNPKDPVLQFAAYGKPLTKDQMEVLAEAQEEPEAEMKRTGTAK
ncbi:MAG: hypothetical protein RDU20_19770 [Desulfomonilaceae bacterium]|nr:hypothetical protein [Desulfomonilaceae bacterium]